MKTFAMGVVLTIAGTFVLVGAATIVGFFCGVTIRVARWVVEA